MFSRFLVVPVLGCILSAIIVVAPAQAVGGLVKPDFCYTIGAGTDDVEVVFFPSKLTITQPELGGDNADYYQIHRDDNRTFDVALDDNKNIHDTDSVGVARTYSVFSRHHDGRSSQAQPCVAYEAVSSISPGRLRDWKRDAVVSHGTGAVATVAGTRHFSGADHDIVSSEISDEESTTLNPAGGLFAFQAHVTLSADELHALKQIHRPSWNVMQRGYSSSAGGQWKMSLVASTKNGLTTAHAQCIARDGDGTSNDHIMRVDSTYELRAGRKATITCVVDDVLNTLQIVVNGRTDHPTKPKPRFGNVNPHHDRSSCWRLAADTISIGNKPKCSQTLTPDDRFQGTIHLARVLRGD